jgi:hypothetical protein
MFSNIGLDVSHASMVGMNHLLLFFYKPEADKLHVFVNASVQLNLWPMMIWCMTIASHVCHQNVELIHGPSFQAWTW